ncbi:hypothetical protein ACF0H5_005754 [Mactra antiquata]
MENCRKTCNLCNSSRSTEHTTMPQNTSTAVCEYKGNQYSQGESWKVDCKLNCTCVDASLGDYSCKDLCYKYVNLPPGVKLVVKPGSCCAEPDIHEFMIDENWPWPWLRHNLSSIEACLYKGHQYLQGESWKDDCKQNCTCVDSHEGVYSCRSICLNWSNLPPVCHLVDAPPGLCCQQVKCPSSIEITIPIAYKDEYPGYIYV